MNGEMTSVARILFLLIRRGTSFWASLPDESAFSMCQRGPGQCWLTSQRRTSTTSHQRRLLWISRVSCWLPLTIASCGTGDMGLNLSLVLEGDSLATALLPAMLLFNSRKD